MNVAPLLRAGSRLLRQVSPDRTVVLTDPKTSATTPGRARVDEVRPGQSFEPGVTVRRRQAAFQLFPDGLAFPPTEGMYLEDGSDRWSIDAVTAVRAEGVVLHYAGSLIR